MSSFNHLFMSLWMHGWKDVYGLLVNVTPLYMRDWTSVILLSVAGPGPSPHQTLRDDCMKESLANQPSISIEGEGAVAHRSRRCYSHSADMFPPCSASCGLQHGERGSLLSFTSTLLLVTTVSTSDTPASAGRCLKGPTRPPPHPSYIPLPSLDEITVSRKSFPFPPL